MSSDKLSGEEKKSLKQLIGVNEIIHSPVRLAILMFLQPRHRASFAQIQKALGLTAGNLSSHIKKLEANELIEVEKVFIDSKPTTLIYVTQKGVTGIAEYARILREALDRVD